MGLQPLEIPKFLQCKDRFYTSESDDSDDKDGPCAKRLKHISQMSGLLFAHLLIYETSNNLTYSILIVPHVSVQFVEIILLHIK